MGLKLAELWPFKAWAARIRRDERATVLASLAGYDGYQIIGTNRTGESFDIPQVVVHDRVVIKDCHFTSDGDRAALAGLATNALITGCSVTGGKPLEVVSIP